MHRARPERIVVKGINAKNEILLSSSFPFDLSFALYIYRSHEQGEINPVSHHFVLSLNLVQSVSQIVLLLSGTFFLNLFVRAHLIPPLNLTFSTLSSNHEIFLL